MDLSLPDQLTLSAHPGWWLVALVVGILVVVLVARRIARGLDSARRSRRGRRAHRSEVAAAALLGELGYEVLDTQIAGRWTIHVDGEPVEIGLRADILAGRDGQTFVAEVKTGQLVPSVQSAATRRQLLEYQLAFAADGVLLVDMERLEVREVSFAVAANTTGTWRAAT